MTTRVLNIEARERQFTPFLASLADFTYTEGEAVEPEVVLTNPDISLYCLDDETKRAVFVELPDGVDLAKVPFVYQTQYEKAVRLIAMPYQAFVRVAQELPAVERLILVYSLGRSGSTLLSHAFNELETVLSLSEPDVATQFVHLHNNGRDSTELRTLLDSAVRFLFKPTHFKRPSTYALKFRSEAVQVMDLYQATFPQARNLFLYRDAISWASSFYRLFQRVGVPEHDSLDNWLPFMGRILNLDLLPFTDYLEKGTKEVSNAQRFALWWLANMEQYGAKYEQGVPALAVRYDDLNAHRNKVVAAIFEYCGLPHLALQSALRAFDRDAQAGTTLARERPNEGNPLRLSASQVDEIQAILQRHPAIKTPDFVASGTLRV